MPDETDGLSPEERDMLRRLREIPDPTEEEIKQIPPLPSAGGEGGDPGPEPSAQDTVHIGGRDIPIDIREQQIGEGGEDNMTELKDLLRQILIEIQDLPEEMADRFGVDS